jgi:hypothetical protein
MLSFFRSVFLLLLLVALAALILAGIDAYLFDVPYIQEKIEWPNQPMHL